MTLRSLASTFVAAIAATVVAAPVAAASADEVVRNAIAAVETSSTMAEHDMIRLAINSEETTSDGTTESSAMTAIVHGDRLQNTRVELSQGISLILNGSNGWALIRGQLDQRPQTPRMAAGTIRQTLFPLLLPYSLQMDGVLLGMVTEDSFDGTPVWVIDVNFESDFFAAPSMVTPWRIFVSRENNLVVGAEYLPAAEFRSMRDEGIRYRYLKRQDVGGINLAAQVLLDGIDLNGVENGHVRVTKISAATAGPLDLTLFIHPDERERMDEGEVF